jgi:hypothetical protein
MKTTIKIVSVPAVICAAVLTFTSTTQAGPFGGSFRRMDTGMTRVSPGRGANDINQSMNPNAAGARANRHGADDPANHDINDDRVGANQPGDDRGRGRHRGRGRGR